MAANHDPMEARVITVSREALRADLAEVELRLTEKITAAVQHKADIAMVQAQDVRIQALERDVVRRDGPQMRDMQAQLREVEDTLRDRAPFFVQFVRLQQDFDKMKSEFRSDAELKEMMRAERTGYQGAQWTWVQRIQLAVTIVATLVALYLTANAVQGNEGEGGSDSAQTAVDYVP